MHVIEVNHLTKDYGQHKGVFDLSFYVKKGEILGFLGPNGSGKTTTIRQLLGFIRPDAGQVQIFGQDCFEQAATIQKNLGYLPGEIALMDDLTGQQFIHWMAELKNVKDMAKTEELIRFLNLNPKGKIKRMSKGMKQKLGLVVALMHDPDVLIFDEPTSGLDPLMQNRFVELVREAKRQGKTILMSSHMFEEIEHTCDRVMMIKDGQLIADETMDSLKNNQKKHYQITFYHPHEASQFASLYPKAQLDQNTVELFWQGSPNPLLLELGHYTIADLDVRSQTLEELFLHYYGGEDK